MPAKNKAKPANILDSANDQKGSLPSVDSKLKILKTELLKQIDLFSPLPQSALDFLIEKSTDRVLEDGEILFKEGFTEEMMYVILSGKMVVRKGSKKVAILGQGEYLGEMSIIDSKPRSASALAMGSVLLMEIPKSLFDKYISSNSKALFEMMKVFSTRIRSDLDVMSSDMLRINNFTHDMRNCLVPLGIAEVLLDEAIRALKGTQESHKKRNGWNQVEKGFDAMVSVRNNLITLIDQSLACATKTNAAYVRESSDIIPLIEETVAEISCHKYLKLKTVKICSQGKIKKGYFNYLDIKRVLQNLLINAGYVTEKNSHIEVHVKNLNDMIQVSVKDYGCGIPDNVKPILLKETYTTKSDGNGFGLMSSKELIEEFQKGKIWFESEVGTGTTFHFTIPHAA